MAFEEIPLEKLRIGMYVKLECSWWRHPFATNKFKVTNRKELQTIRKINKLKLFYDPDLSDPESVEVEEAPEEENPSSTLSQAEDSTQASAETPEEEIFPGDDEFDSPFEEKTSGGQREFTRIDRPQRIEAYRKRRDQLKQMERSHQDALRQSNLVLKKMNSGDFAGVQAAGRMLTGIAQILNQEKMTIALIELMNSGDPDEPLVFHSLNVAILSMLVGKEFSLSEEELFNLGLGALVHDIGMFSLPQDLRLTTAGFAHAGAKQGMHIESGRRTVERISDFPEAAKEIIVQHHERLNGQGYPKGLRDQEISFLSKIVMVVDEYDDLCNNPNRPQNLTPYETLSYLYQNLRVKRQGEFSEDVLVTLIRILGVYPPGTLVELSNGSIGTVVNINSACRTNPQVLLYAPDIPRDEAIIFDMAEDEDLKIIKSLRPREVGREIRNFLNPQRMTGFFPNSSEILAARDPLHAGVR